MKYIKAVLPIITLSFITAFGVGGCNQKEENKQVVQIGAVLPLTGELAIYGEKTKKGIDLAVEEVNNNGGIENKPLNIIYEDTRGSSSEAVSATKKLININHIEAIIGAVSSEVTLSMIPVIDKADVLLFSTAASSPKLSGVSQYFFRNWPSDVAEASTLAEFAIDEFGAKRASIIYVNNDYGIGLKNKFQNKYSSLGGEIATTASYTVDNKNFRTLILKIKQANPGIIFLAGYTKMGTITKQLREAGVKNQIIACTNYGDPEVLSLAGKAADGVIFATPIYNPEKSKQPEGQKFVNRYKAKYGEIPSLFEANAYDAVMIIAEAIQATSYNGKDIARYIRNLEDYQAASGEISFTEKGNVVMGIGIKIVKNGSFVNYNQVR